MRPVVEVYHNPPAPLLELVVVPFEAVRTTLVARRRAIGAEGGECVDPGVSVLDASFSEDVIRVTSNHRFYVRGRGWVEAGNLRIADQFRDPDGRDLFLVEMNDSGRS